MVRLKLLCAVAVLLATAVGARYLWPRGVGDHHAVDWYVTHDAERDRVLQLCSNDHALDADPDCRNAYSGAKGAFAKEMRDSVPPGFWNDIKPPPNQQPAGAPQNTPAKAGQ